MNDINFPAGVLQPPLFDPKMDDAPNYGNTGGTIGHELTHGFDDEGRQFDAQGNLHDWWTKKDAEGFEERADCVRINTPNTSSSTTSRSTANSHSAKTSPISAALLLAYVAWKNATKDEDLKPIDGFTPDQRFFIGYGAMGLRKRRALKNCASSPSPTRTPPANTVSTAPSPTCPNSPPPSTATSANPWSAPNNAASGNAPFVFAVVFG